MQRVLREMRLPSNVRDSPLRGVELRRKSGHSGFERVQPPRLRDHFLGGVHRLQLLAQSTALRRLRVLPLADDAPQLDGRAADGGGYVIEGEVGEREA